MSLERPQVHCTPGTRSAGVWATNLGSLFHLTQVNNTCPTLHLHPTGDCYQVASLSNTGGPSPTIEAQVAQMVRNRIIEESTSPWSSPILVVPKLDSSPWLYNDIRSLNKIWEFGEADQAPRESLVCLLSCPHQGLMVGPPGPYLMAQDHL